LVELLFLILNVVNCYFIINERKKGQKRTKKDKKKGQKKGKRGKKEEKKKEKKKREKLSNLESVYILREDK
jgi:membrane protein implicated in regulation of membrane protease activity